MFLFNFGRNTQSAPYTVEKPSAITVNTAKKQKPVSSTKHPYVVLTQQWLDTLDADIEHIDFNKGRKQLVYNMPSVKVDQLADFEFDLTRFTKLKSVTCNVYLHIEHENISKFDTCYAILNLKFSPEAQLIMYDNINLILTQFYLLPDSILFKNKPEHELKIVTHYANTIKNIPKSVETMYVGVFDWDDFSIFPFDNVKQILAIDSVFYNYKTIKEKNIKIWPDGGVYQSSCYGLISTYFMTQYNNISTQNRTLMLEYEHEKLKSEVAELKKLLADKGVIASPSPAANTTAPPSDITETTSE